MRGEGKGEEEAMEIVRGETEKMWEVVGETQRRRQHEDRQWARFIT